MGKTFKKLTALILCVMMIVPFISFETSAETENFKEYTVSADGEKRTSNVNTSRWASPRYSYIYENGNNIVIVDVDDSVSVSTYSRDFELISEKTIEFELPVFGGFFSGETFNFIVFGQSNEEEDIEKEVYRIVKYDKNFNKISHASILGSQCHTVEPFDAGSVAMAESGNELTVHTSRLRFTSDDGYNHQSQFTVVLDTTSMTPTNNLKLFQDNHVSHSFNQFVQYENGKRVLLDHGDAYPRCVLLSKYNGMSRNGYENYTEVNLFDIPGETGANCTGVFLGGFEVSENNYIVSMNTIDHSKATAYDSYNIYGLEYDLRDAILVTVPKNNLIKENVKHIYLTDYINNSKHASAPKLIKLSEKMFAVMWKEYNLVEKEDYFGTKYNSTEYNGIRYVIVNENGDKLTSIKSLGKEALLSDDCQPLYTDQKIIWYYNTGNGERHICSLDLSEDITEIGCEHNIVSVPAKEATCTSAGVNSYYKCTVCGGLYKDAAGTIKTSLGDEVIPMLPHSGGVATCQSTGKCAVCGAEYIPLAEHKTGDWHIVADSTCKTEGEKYKLCSVCGEVVEKGTIGVKAHTPGNWETVSEAKCETDGKEVLKCTVCGDTLSEKAISAVGHGEPEWVTKKEASCSEQGIKQEVCAVCKKPTGKTEIIDKKDHTPASYWSKISDPTCTKSGLKVKKCTICGEVVESEIIEANGHSIRGVEWTVITSATCENAGERVKICKVCGEAGQKEILNPTGHISTTEWLTRKEVTCTEDGELYKKCTVCGMDTETQVLTKLGHKFEGEWVTTKNATCTEDGVKTRYCTRCEHSVDQPVPAKGHSESDWITAEQPDCTNQGLKVKNCTTCGIRLKSDAIPATGHNIGEEEIIKKADCKNEGTKVKRCTTCKDIVITETIPVSGHEGGNWVITKTPQNGSYGIKSKFCIGCGIKIEEKIIYSITYSVIRDYATGIEIVYPEETFENNVTMNARNLSGYELSEKINSEIGRCTYKGYEAVLFDNGVYVTPAKSYSLRLPLPDGMNYKTAEVYAISMNTGNLVKVDATYESGYFLIDKVDAVQYVIVERIVTITLSETNLSLKKGDSFMLYANTDGRSVTFVSSNPSVVTVDINGNVTAVGAGTATITATVDGYNVKAECNVEVTQSFFDMIIEAFSAFFKMIAELFGL